MLRIYPTTLDMCRDIAPYCRLLARADPDLARQLRRAATSVPLNVAEGMYSRGKLRQARYHTALGSARETLACLEVAHAMGLLDAADPVLTDQLGKIIGTLVKLATS